MEALVLQHSKWIEEYNCDAYDPEGYLGDDYDHFWLSISYIVLGAGFLCLYLPCMYAMVKDNLLNESCYKIMLCLAVYDVLGLLTSGIISGIFGLLRFGFCISPITHYILGGFSVFTWFGQVMSALLLALNRCIFLRNEYIANILFGGKRAWIWIAIGPFGWSFIGFLVSRPGILSLSSMVWFFNPHDGYIFDKNMIYISSYHYANNLLAATALPGVYIVFLVIYYLKTNHWTFKNTSYLQQSVFFQSLFISFFTSMLATFYIAIQYIHIPKQFFYVTQVLWIVFSGLASIIYLIMNRSIRRRIFVAVGGSEKLNTVQLQQTPVFVKRGSTVISVVSSGH